MEDIDIFSFIIHPDSVYAGQSYKIQGSSNEES